MEEAGGIHIIQTFLSEEESEEVQIKGRSGRQGNNGSYTIILLIDDLSEFNVEPEDVKKAASVYEMLREFRSLRQQNLQKDNTDSLKEIKVQH